MEPNLSTLEVAGYRAQPIPATFIHRPDPSRHLGVILPGYRYSADMPPLHYTGRALFEHGADVLSVDYTYFRTDFIHQPESEQNKWMAGDILAACEAVFSRHPYEQITLVGKSLGTIAMGNLLAEARFRGADCIWFTPILALQWLCQRIEQARPRSLFVIGTADQFYRPDLLERLGEVTQGRVLALEGLNHGLEIPGDIPGSLAALTQMTQAVQGFVDPTRPPA